MTFLGEPMKKPDGMSLKAEMAWTFYGFENGKDWRAVLCYTGSVIVTDGTGDLEYSMTCEDVDDFVAWLETCADDMLLECPDVLFLAFVPKAILTDDVVNAMLDAIRKDDERRKKHIANC